MQYRNSIYMKKLGASYTALHWQLLSSAIQHYEPLEDKGCFAEFQMASPLKTNKQIKITWLGVNKCFID